MHTALYSSRTIFLLPLCLCLLLVSCGGADSSDQDVEATATRFVPTPTAITSVQATSTPTESVTGENVSNLVIWWPDALYPTDADVLADQIREFGESQGEGFNIELRRKRTQDVGGIMSTLRSASRVAPGALPDLTLLRRSDLVSAQQSGLVYPIDDIVPAGIADDTYATALNLGLINGENYAIPYALQVIMVVSRVDPETDEQAVMLSFDDILSSDKEWVFPAGRLNGLSETLYIQYLSAGGQPPAEDRILVLDEDALRAVLEFYEQARDAGILDASLLDYTSSLNYEVDLATGRIDRAVVNSTEYMMLSEETDDLFPSSIPTMEGNPLTVMDGWMWVVTTSDPARQQLVTEFLEWMLTPERQLEITQATFTLPSQQSTLRQMDTETGLYDLLLENAVMPLSDTLNGVLGRGIQNALSAVLSGESTADEALDTLLGQLDE